MGLVELTILHTNDIHGRLEGAAVGEAELPGQVGKPRVHRVQVLGGLQQVLRQARDLRRARRVALERRVLQLQLLLDALSAAQIRGDATDMLEHRLAAHLGGMRGEHRFHAHAIKTLGDLLVGEARGDERGGQHPKCDYGGRRHTPASKRNPKPAPVLKRSKPRGAAKATT